MITSTADYLTGATLPTLPPAITNETRLIRELRREMFVAKNGLRDAQWALLRAILQARELIYIESPQFSRTAHPTGPAKEYEVDLVAAIVSRLQSQPNLRVIICTPKLSDFAPHYANFARQHYAARVDAASLLLSAAPDRVAMFHPVGFPGRPAHMRTTSVIVDDVWALVGASHFRRRGMTFDGSVAVASCDRQMEEGYSLKVRAFRRDAMAARLRVARPNNQAPSGDWVRLERPSGAFALVADLLAEGGLGRIEPLWPGPYDPNPDPSVIAADVKFADPEGSVDDDFLTLFAGVLEAMD